MTSTVAVPTTAVVDLLRDHRELADERRKSFDPYRDADGDVKADDLTDYDDSRTTTAIEAPDCLDAAMETARRRGAAPWRHHDDRARQLPGTVHRHRGAAGRRRTGGVCQLAQLAVVRQDGSLIDIDGAHAPAAVPGAEGLVAVRPTRSCGSSSATPRTRSRPDVRQAAARHVLAHRLTHPPRGPAV